MSSRRAIGSFPEEKQFHVVFRGHRKWCIRMGGAFRASVADIGTQALAVKMARRRARHAHGCVVVHRPNGSVRRVWDCTDPRGRRK